MRLDWAGFGAKQAGVQLTLKQKEFYECQTGVIDKILKMPIEKLSPAASVRSPGTSKQ